MHPFSNYDFYDFGNQIHLKIINELKEATAEFILNSRMEDLINNYYSRYQLSPLNIDRLSITKKEGKAHDNKVIAAGNFHSYQANIRPKITNTYNFNGSSELFKVRANEIHAPEFEIFVDDRNNTVSFDIHVFSLGEKMLYKPEHDDPALEYKTKTNDCLDILDNYISKVNVPAINFNSTLTEVIEREFKKVFDVHKRKDDFLRAIDMQVGNEIKPFIETKNIIIKEIPEVQINTRKYSNPKKILGNEIYRDIIETINLVGHAMQRKPSLYIGKDEESLRDLFLLFLEFRYKNVTATGETFNKGGSTDILLKESATGHNIFIAECKFWGGKKLFNDTINQLFKNYVTYRDTKVSILFFVKTEDVNKIFNKIKEYAPCHQYYLSSEPDTDINSMTFIFHLPGDKNSPINLEIIAFHFNRKTTLQEPFKS